MIHFESTSTKFYLRTKIQEPCYEFERKYQPKCRLGPPRPPQQLIKMMQCTCHAKTFRTFYYSASFYMQCKRHFLHILKGFWKSYVTRKCFVSLTYAWLTNSRDDSQCLHTDQYFPSRKTCWIFLSECHTYVQYIQRPQSRDYIFKSTSWVLLYRDTIERVLFYIKMAVMMS